MSGSDDVDLVVVGSGGAAMAAAIAVRQRGATVVLIERGTLRGTCVNVSCVPSKTLLAAAGARHAALTNPFQGALTSADGVDLAARASSAVALAGRRALIPRPGHVGPLPHLTDHGHR